MRKKKTQPQEFYGGRIKPLVDAVIALLAKHPELASNPEEIHQRLMHAGRDGYAPLVGYGKRDECFNCKRSMKITVYTADLHDALLILAMGREVHRNLDKGLDFTNANKIHLPTLVASHATIKRNTKCDYLGFVKQPDNWRGTGYWLLTSWAFKALRGDRVPRSVKYWEGKMIERSDETTTLSEMFRTHTELVRAALAKGRAVKADHRAQFNDYDPADWTQFGGYIQESNPQNAAMPL